MIHNKRAQTEAIGLIIIVIIVMIGGIFILVRNSKTNSLERESFSDPKLAQSFLNALMDTRTRSSLTVKDVIRNCHDTKKKNLCGGDCCDYAEQTIKNSLELTLDKWQKPYMLSIEQNGVKNIDDIFTEGCDEYSPSYKSGQYTIPSLPRSIQIELTICK